MSVFKTLGIPNIEKILSSNGITDFADTVVKVLTTGYLEYSSITTSMCCPFEYGPQRSIHYPVILTNKTNNDNNVRVNDTKRKQKMKEYFELKRNTKPADLKVGDSVLVKQEKNNKLSTPFNPEPMTIKNKKGNTITAAAENKEITRNLSFFKMIGKPVLCDDEIDDILESGKSNETPNTQPRRSSRKRKTPGYLNDFVCAY